MIVPLTGEQRRVFVKEFWIFFFDDAERVDNMHFVPGLLRAVQRCVGRQFALDVNDVDAPITELEQVRQ